MNYRIFTNRAKTKFIFLQACTNYSVAMFITGPKKLIDTFIAYNTSSITFCTFNYISCRRFSRAFSTAIRTGIIRQWFSIQISF